jgi:hypothetical protein
MSWLLNVFRFVAGGVTTYYQRQIPGSVVLNDSSSNQAQVPGGAFVDGA